MPLFDSGFLQKLEYLCENLRSRVESLGIQDSVVMPGFVENVPALMRGADVVVIPSLLEGQGIVAPEAMAARVPVVATRVGGLIETIVDGETGLRK